MLPQSQLPIHGSFGTVDEYVDALLDFVTSHELFRALCGGVHILGFFTVRPDIYQTTLPMCWRQWFALHDVGAILDLLLREDIAALEALRGTHEKVSVDSWRGGEAPPTSLLDFIIAVRKLSLIRKTHTGQSEVRPPHNMVVGMKPKKIHETQHFARYISELRAHIDCGYTHKITHIVDFGSGQNYLGRTLASLPYNERIIAIERRHHNIGGAQVMDIHAKLVEKPKKMRNKKAFRSQSHIAPRGDFEDSDTSVHVKSDASNNSDRFLNDGLVSLNTNDHPITYVEQNIENGDLAYLDSVIALPARKSSANVQFMVISLHSCGDLLHHGLRSLILNTKVKAVAMIGCCYHLTSEAMGPPTWKPPYAQRQDRCPTEADLPCNPNGFPLSERLLTYRHRAMKGIKLNITARMMASQAAENWTDQDCNSFFTRHFYRALLQKIFSDYGVLSQADATHVNEKNSNGDDVPSSDVPITIGSLRKACYTSFVAYVRGAIQKMREGRTMKASLENELQSLKDEDILAYEERYAFRKKELSIMWSLMAFCAGVSESVILVDRFLYLREQPEVDQCWVEPVFDYRQSPRNLAVIGIKKSTVTVA